MNFQLKLNKTMLLYPEKEAKKVESPKFGKGEDKDLVTFLNFCKKFSSNFDEDLVKKAYQFNIEANKNLFRKSGEPFYTHPLEVASFLIENIMFDIDMVVGALLHDVLGKNQLFSIKDIETEFGSVISLIVDNVHRITNLERRDIGDIEYFRRLILALTTDVRIIFIKIADRYHDMKTISYLLPDTQRKIAEDTMQVYVPLAHRFGLYSIKSDLEDLSFKVLDKESYEKIVHKLRMTKKERDEYLRNFAKPIIERLKEMTDLKENNVKFEVHGRVKHIYSIYNKTLLRGKPVEELYDLIGLRIILETDDESYCERVMEEIKSLYPHLPETYKNYIKHPKPNGYKSIHCAFLGEGAEKVEVQVRTRNMHLVAEKGIAAHYHYKSGLLSVDTIFNDPQIEKWANDIRELLAKKEEVPLEKLMESFNYDIFSDEIYVLTPKQEIKILPKNATVLDFAYSIHTDVGNHCAGAKINGKIHNYFTTLKNGDVVEIIYGSNLEPELSWLDKVITAKAKNSIVKYYKQNLSEKQRLGKELFEKIIEKNNSKQHKSLVLNKCLEILKFTNSEEFYLELFKDKELHEIVDLLVSFLKQKNFKFLFDQHKHSKSLKKILSFAEKRVLIENRTYVINLASCCSPVRGDDTVAFIRAGNVFIHRADCKHSKFEFASDDTRRIEFSWDIIKKDYFDLALKITYSNFDDIFNLVERAMEGRDDVQIYKLVKEDSGSENKVLKLLLKVKDNSIEKKLEKILSTNEKYIKVTRIGIEEF